MTAMTRTQIRDTIARNAKARSLRCQFFGTEIELKQPTVKEALAVREEFATEGAAKMTVYTLVQYAYVPGTNEKVFEDTDTDWLLGLPFSEDWSALSNKVASLIGIDPEEEAKNSDATT